MTGRRLRGKNMITGKVYGIDEVLKRLDAAEKEILRGLHRGMTEATLATEVHIKKEYQRPVTGKGFTDRTGALRKSIGSKVVFHASKHVVIGYIFAGMRYAVNVEFRWGGKYAYLWPGVMDMKSKIWQIIKNETKGVFR